MRDQYVIENWTNCTDMKDISFYGPKQAINVSTDRTVNDEREGSTDRLLYSSDPHIAITVILSFDSLNSPIIWNTITLLSYYALHYTIHAILFSEIIQSQDLDMFGITVINQFKTNEFGLPILKDMIRRARRMYNAEYVVYINSDILLSESLFSVIQTVHSQQKNQSHLIVCRVYNSPVPSFPVVSSMNLSKLNVTSIRSSFAIDVFAFSRSFPLNRFKNVVVGRWYIDNAVILHAKTSGIPIIDISDYVLCYHQGVVSAARKKHRIAKRDFYYNTRYYSDSEYRSNGGLLSASIQRITM